MFDSAAKGKVRKDSDLDLILDSEEFEEKERDSNTSRSFKRED
ncbi:MAG: hypothetical protein ACE5K0_07660 [Candidatus Methanofastidiosia archaeon]